MTEEERTTNGDEQAPEETPEAAEEAASEEAAQEEASAEEAAPEEEAPAEEGAPEEEPPAEEAAGPAAEEAEEAPADEAPAEEAPAAEAGDAPAEEAEELSPKQLRKRERSQASGPPRPQRSVEERVAERAEHRSVARERRRRYRQGQRGQRGEPGVGTPPAERERPAAPKVRQGTVVASRAEKTISVRIEVVRRHPRYEKIVRRSRTIHAHDEGNEASDGDTVSVIESRPRSRTKRWRLLEIIERAPARTPVPALEEEVPTPEGEGETA